ncbi:2,3-bisphosphoglycerate-dependent phosphoglycerate mutase [Lactobacillus selangorensis]|uniref:2,3-bisphosphoglycerate-dependent phosphoglycerate mutase n=1 Tax=Lactobacillus selangorensis TaxID=81857 RepID=A0A0R2FKS1_9LACO|nr:2,3-diphosphoglycerate-dependent phosphoglycerate mutase [Lactobacillus selangorensis]KRN29176.1 2,3-bisphosphoglycerate-dependent phosphoglycerate mutase [Lactobacillus selangorensis]KRN31466.1 2,3-bisphosphoglycerate-dependent phosphoglycerate mutase [Lactobacillus selangorensis]
MAYLVIVRHGQSQANKENTYTGWSDVPLTQQGVQEAQAAGQKIAQLGLTFDAVYTSVLQRAIRTANLIMAEMDQLDVPLYKSWRLNERHYGALRGLNKDQTRQVFGAGQVALWRRSYTTEPPLLMERYMERRYAAYGSEIIPRGESLKMASQRLVPYWQDEMVPRLRDGKNLLVVAHGSTLRALVKYLENISDQDIDGVEIENGQPIVYKMDQQLNIVTKQLL